SRLACTCAACQLSVEPIERIVKMRELGPAEFRMCGLVVGPMREKKVTRSFKRFGPHRNVSFSEDSPQTSHMDRRYSAVIITLACPQHLKIAPANRWPLSRDICQRVSTSS